MGKGRARQGGLQNKVHKSIANPELSNLVVQFRSRFTFEHSRILIWKGH
jgi:hypothetical protein